MFGYLGLFMLQASTLLTAWRFYVWARREEARADELEARLLALPTNPFHVHAEVGGDDAE